MEIIYFIIKIILLLFSPVTKSLSWIYNKLPFRIIFKNRSPKLALIESSRRSHMWSIGKRGEEEIIFINTFWQITNTLKYDLNAMNAYLVKPQKVKGQVLMKDVKSEVWGSYPLEVGYTTEMDILFLVDKKHVKKNSSNLKIEFEIEDVIGKRHKIKNIEIPPVFVNHQKIEKLKIEDPTTITNPVIKKVIAILKTEVEQYKVRGRREGRLGTVEWIKGVIEYRAMDAKIKFLYDNSNSKNISSELLDSLIQLYKSANSFNKRIIINSVMPRINKKTEYRDIGYFMIFFLFEIGKLEDGLKKALKDLQGDKANAFSDVLRLLDFLLAYRYEEFKKKDLESIEKFVYSTKEHPFSIKERINAIRILRIKQ